MADLLAVYDGLRARVPEQVPPGQRHERVGPLLRVTGWHRGFVEAGPDLRGEDVDSLVAGVVAHFAARGEAVEWKVRGHDLPADLPDRLAAAGFVAEDTETVLLGEAAALADGPGPPPGVVLRPAEGEADLHRLAALLAGVWGAPRDWLPGELAGTAGVHVLLAEAGGEVLSGGWLTEVPGTEVAGLWGGATRADSRGRGVYRALVAARARIAVQRGYRYLHVDASPDSRPVLQWLGLRPVTTATAWVWSPPVSS